MRIIYFPLEPIKERYTIQLSASKTGWLERNWIKHQIPYIRIEGKSLRDTIKTGTVLDANSRGYWALSQVQNFLKLLDEGHIRQSDVLYFDDFWHPGVETLQYSFDLLNFQPKRYALLHAQSIDIFDFTYPMRYWMRYFEKGISRFLDGIFVTSTCLKDLIVLNDIAREFKVFLTGLPYNSEEVKEHFPEQLPRKKNQVIFSSRWDKEKNPDLYLDIVARMRTIRPDINFVISTSSSQIRSNDPVLINKLNDCLINYHNLELRKNQSKEQYYYNLLESKIQINTADQDFVSWTLLESTTCGCRPLYPYFRSFPEALQERHEFMYEKNNVEQACEKIMKYIDHYYAVGQFNFIYKPFDESWKRMLNIMKGEDYEPLYSS